jgi:phosphatidylinositol-4,5-bisphosphate 3-kinase
MMLGFAHTDELVFNWDCLLIQVDGVREQLLKKKTPELLVLSRPSELKVDFKEQAVVKSFISDFVTALLTRIVREARPEVIEFSTYNQPDSGRLMQSNTFSGRPSSRTVPRLSHKVRQAFSTILPTPLFEASEPIDVRSLDLPLRIKVLGIDNVRMYKIDKESGVPLLRLHPTCVKLEMSLFAGGVELEKSRYCTEIALSCKNINRQFNDNIRWNEWVQFQVLYSELPLSTSVRLVVSAKVAKTRKPGVFKEKCLGWVNFRLFDFSSRLRTGISKVGLYPRYARQDCTGTTADNAAPDACQLFLQIESFLQPAIYGLSQDCEFDLKAYFDELLRPIPDPHLRELERLETQGPLYELSTQDTELLWRYRAYCTKHPKLLPKLFLSVDWCNPSNVRDIHMLIELCEHPAPIEALELLDGKYADDKVREFGVRCLEDMSTSQLQQFLIQLVQAVKFEPFHYSPLLHFLLKRALEYPKRIGHYLFWLLKSEMNDPYFKERYGLLLEQYLLRCGPIKSSLVLQDYLVKTLEVVAREIQNDRDMSKEEQLRRLRDTLIKLNAAIPEVVTLPLNPKILIRSFQVDECKVMRSKKRPLYLVVLRANYEPVHVLFKAGDDLRQDMLTLQAFKLMESLWLTHDLDLQLSLYDCLTLGHEVGMLEIVPESCTLAEVHKWAGGQRAVFSERTLLQWLKANATCDRAVDNFIRSCAGYSIATYVLGVADRHNDNIMMRRTGQIFHIDFGHFLGYFKKKLGIKRETAPFVFTPDFAFAMGKMKSPGYEEFLRLSVAAYNVLRHNSRLIYLLLALMLSSGITELTRKDLKYLEKTLIGGTDDAADKHFRKLVVSCMNNYMTRINFSIHIIANS